MGTLNTNPHQPVAVPRDLLSETIEALRLGYDAVLDRDWDCYSDSERVEAASYAEATFMIVANQLEQLLET